MKMDVRVSLNLDGMDLAKAVVKDAAKKTLRDVVVEVAGDSVKGSPVRTGNNRRSIYYGVSYMGSHQPASAEAPKEGDTSEGPDESLLDSSKIEGAVYSTSGYGGILETGSVKMQARPYMKPALDKFFTEANLTEKMKGYLK